MPLGPGALSILGPSNIVSGSGGAGPPPYVASAVHFDGATALGLTNQALGVATDSATGLLAVWLKGSNIFNLQVSTANGDVMQDANNFNANCGGNSPSVLPNVPGLFMFDVNGNGDFYTSPTAQAQIPIDTWTLMLWSWNTNFPAGSRLVQSFYGDTQNTITFGDDSGTAFLVNWSDTEWAFCSGTVAHQGNTFTDVADFQLWCGAPFLDLTVTANRRLFIDGSGKPVNPSVAAAVLGQQTVLLSGDATTFANNQGNAPATSVLTGTLTNASSHP